MKILSYNLYHFILKQQFSKENKANYLITWRFYCYLYDRLATNNEQSTVNHSYVCTEVNLTDLLSPNGLQCATWSKQYQNKTRKTYGDPESADTKQWYLINDDKCCILPRFLTILLYCFGGSLPLNTEITRRWEWLSWQIGIKRIFIRVVHSCEEESNNHGVWSSFKILRFAFCLINLIHLWEI